MRWTNLACVLVFVQCVWWWVLAPLKKIVMRNDDWGKTEICWLVYLDLKLKLKVWSIQRTHEDRSRSDDGRRGAHTPRAPAAATKATTCRRCPRLGLGRMIGLHHTCRSIFIRVRQPSWQQDHEIIGRQLPIHWHQKSRADSIDEQIELQAGFNRNQGPEQAKPYRFTQEARGSTTRGR